MTATANSLLEKTEQKLEKTDTSTSKTIEITETVPKTEAVGTAKKAEILKKSETAKKTEALKKGVLKKTETKESFSSSTLELAAQDVRRVINQQSEQGQSLTTKLNILFVTNGALFTSLTISRLLFVPSIFSLAEMLEFLLNFTLLINAFLPRQLAVSPNLGDKKFLERYLVLPAEEYQLRMLVNLVETYNANKQRLEDISSSLKYSAYVTWGVALTITLHVVAAYFLPVIDLSSFG
ncbi:hypothetical protein [Lyngbya aestuarii]|uniref:hypothetical protein n=1 Tax=Lyngbya aestuarii TaxID=118322 RepID=UPI00403D8395